MKNKHILETPCNKLAENQFKQPVIYFIDHSPFILDEKITYKLNIYGFTVSAFKPLDFSKNRPFYISSQPLCIYQYKPVYVGKDYHNYHNGCIFKNKDLLLVYLSMRFLYLYDKNKAESKKYSNEQI